MAKKKKYEAQMRVVGIGFNISVPDRRDGEICGNISSHPLEYTKLVGEGRNKEEQSIEVRGLKLLSCWMDPMTGNCIKAHGLVYHRNPQHLAFLRDLDEAKFVPCPNGYEMTTDPTGIQTKGGMVSIVRYALKTGQTYHELDKASYDPYYVYETKAKALNEMVEVMRKHRTIGGLSTVSWNRLPDSLMVELGFEKIHDLIVDTKGRSRGIPMWKGNVNNAFLAGGYGGPSADSAKQMLDLLSRAMQLTEKAA